MHLPGAIRKLPNHKIPKSLNETSGEERNLEIRSEHPGSKREHNRFSSHPTNDMQLLINKMYIVNGTKGYLYRTSYQERRLLVVKTGPSF